jgi:asparagine synthase (glutamine-hydrolysing)
MCGIVGIADPLNNFQDKKRLIKELNDYQFHRGPDDSGFYNDNYVSLGFRRLSIIDLEKGNQPIIKQNILTIYNGEIYNFVQLRNELIELGAEFYSKSDSEVVANAFLFWGIDCLKKFDGMFAICFYDQNKKEIYLARDRMGIKPLHYTIVNNALFFSSEILTLTKIPGFKKKINLNAVSSYLSFRYPVDDKNLFFENIFRLENGSYIKFNLEKSLNLTKKKFWDIPKNNNNFDNLNLSDIEEKLDGLLKSSVKNQLISDVPLGILLSGGLDSSLIASIASKFKKQLNTYSVSFIEKNYDESDKAKLVSNHIGSKHYDLKIDKKFFIENLSTLIDIKAAPASIPHEFALYSLCKEIKKEVSVLLSGEGADEFFGGYSRVQKSAYDFNKTSFLKRNFDKKKFFNFFLDRYKWFGIQEKEGLFSDDSKKIIDNDLVNKPFENIFMKSSKNETYSIILECFQKNHIKALLDRLDLMSMRSGIEARVPFLDHKILEFINNLPFNYKIKWKSRLHKYFSIFSSSENYSEKNDINKFLLRSCSKKYLPKSTTNEKKLGFPLPMNDWMKDDKIKQIYFDKETLNRGIFDKKYLLKLFDFNLNKNSNSNFDFSGKKIWMLVNLELWIRKFL